MTTPTSRLSYTKCFELFEAALNDPKGIRITFKSAGDARHFRLRLHAARSLDRRENAETLEQDHALFGRSIYDDIVCKIREGKGEETYLYLERLEAKHMEIESLSELEEEETTQVGFELTKQGVMAISTHKIPRRTFTRSG